VRFLHRKQKSLNCIHAIGSPFICAFGPVYFVMATKILSIRLRLVKPAPSGVTVYVNNPLAKYLWHHAVLPSDASNHLTAALGERKNKG